MSPNPGSRKLFKSPKYNYRRRTSPRFSNLIQVCQRVCLSYIPFDRKTIRQEAASKSKMYPTEQEKAVIEEAEKVMVDTMAKYDPSHDRYHGG